MYCLLGMRHLGEPENVRHSPCLEGLYIIYSEKLATNIEQFK